ncbi:MAG: hypothetical protein VW741_07650 [Flammeovirgaceae bacterium]
MKYLRVLFFIMTTSLASCGFEDNLPCKATECENNPPIAGDSENEG